MGEVLSFKRPRPSEKHQGKTLCKSGFHRWEAVKDTPFDSQQGRLVTRYRCSRCGAVRTQGR